MICARAESGYRCAEDSIPGSVLTVVKSFSNFFMALHLKCLELLCCLADVSSDANPDLLLPVILFLLTINSRTLPVATAEIWNVLTVSSQHHPSTRSGTNWKTFFSSDLFVVITLLDLVWLLSRLLIDWCDNSPTFWAEFKASMCMWLCVFCGAQLKNHIAYANSKGIEVGGYDLIVLTRDNVPDYWRDIGGDGTCIASSWSVTPNGVNFVNWIKND